jgi:hypothetical protein
MSQFVGLPQALARARGIGSIGVDTPLVAGWKKE